MTSMKKEPDSHGNIFWHNEENQLHNEEGPAEIYANGTQKWRFNGLLHRADGPAVIYPNGTEIYYQMGVLHRADGPAMTMKDGTEVFYQNGKLHNESGPARKSPKMRKIIVDGKETIIQTEEGPGI